jgi:ABC-type multidrug transport system ATPase subunit
MEPLLQPTATTEPRSSTCWTQFKVLVWKNWLVSIRNWRGTVGIILTPVFVCLILSSFQALSNSVLSADDPSPISTFIPPLPKCSSGDRSAKKCETIVYAPSVPWVDDLMETLCLQNNLEYGIDVIPLPNSTTNLNNTWCVGNINQTVPIDEYIAPWFHIPKKQYVAKQLMEHGQLTYPCNWFHDNTTLQNYLLLKPNQTQNAILFTSAYIDASLPTTIPGFPQLRFPTGYNISVGYTIFYNATISKFPIQGNNHALETMQALDNAILKERVTSRTNSIISMNAKYAHYPSPKPRLTGYDVVSQQGGIWFFLPGCIIFFSLFVELVTEKELKLKLGMTFVGMKQTAYWFSYIFSGLVFSILSAIVLIISGRICGYSTFINTDLSVLWVLYFTFNISMCGVSFFLASLVNKRKSAQTIGYSFILVGFVFQTIICTGYGSLIDLLFSNDVAWWVNMIRYLLSCYPPFSFAKSFYCISDIAGKQYHYNEGIVNPGNHFYWFNGTQTSHKTLLGHAVIVPPMFDSIDLMILDMFGFFIFAWYLDNILMSNDGNSRVPWFCCTSDYWGGCCPYCCRSKKQRSHSFVMYVDDNNNNNNFDDRNEPALIVDHLVKEYGGSLCSGGRIVRAVDGLSFSVKNNSILALLGHNGAGKSTTIGILTGLYPLTSGVAKLFGHDVSETNGISKIQSLSGVCPQHDILWDELTALEHAKLFAHLKGVPSNCVHKECTARLAFMGLTSVQNDRSCTFSGGMKRRLSVAMATIGDPPFLVLDEPTTGMDPVNRRLCWKLIQKLKKNHLIIVTTHSMIEADVLGDQVVIMTHGKSACSGTPLNIKKQHGDGYTLSVILKINNIDQINDTEQEILNGLLHSLKFIHNDNNNNNTLKIVQRDGIAIKFSIPNQLLNAIPCMLRYLESIEGILINEWGVSDATLESAFLNITAKSGFIYQNSVKEIPTATGTTTTKETKIEVDNNDTMENAPFNEEHTLRDNYNEATMTKNKTISLCQPFFALLEKNFLLLSRQRCSCCCQIVTPVLVMLLLTLLQAIIRTQISPSESVTIPGIPYPLNVPSLASAITKGDHSTEKGGECLEFFYWTNDNKNVKKTDEAVKNLTSFIPQRNCSLKKPWNENIIKVPYFKKKSNWSDIQLELFDDLTVLNKQRVSILENMNLEYPNFITPDGVIDFHELNYNNISFTFSVNDANIALYHRPNGFTRLASKHASLFSDSVQLFTQGKMAFFSMISSAYIEYTTRRKTGTSPSINPIVEEYMKSIDSIVGIKTVSTMPLNEKPDLLAIVEIFGSFLYPLALTLQLPVYIYIIVLEKETKLRELQKTMGMSMLTYWCASSAFNLILYFTVAFFFWVCGIIVNMRFFTQTGSDILVLFFILWGLSLSSMAMLISSIISSRRVATVIGYMIVLFGNGIALILSDGIYGNIPNLSVSNTMPYWMFLNPQFAMVRFIYKSNFRCAALLDCYNSLYSINLNDEITICLLFLFFDAIWITLLAIYLDQVVPSQYGVHKSLCYCFNCFTTTSSSNNSSSNDASHMIAHSGASNQEEDDDVARERHTVAHSNRSKYVVCCENLRKEFQLDAATAATKTTTTSTTNLITPVDKKVAVHSFTIGIKGGELFGLLGENGAGKTTLVNLLVGTLAPTTGDGFINGCNIKTDIDGAHLMEGVCPQHDILWDALTAKEHLLFYSKMKKVPYHELNNHVNQSLSDVGLLKYQNRLSSKLSGGMKRRLSIAISMIGNSPVVFLDEPTTGLDPTSRRAIWKIITDAKKKSKKYNRAMILTTHFMDEAESLCSRIGIMTNGHLRCIAGQQRLKSKYGGGYKVTINYNEDDWNSVQKMMHDGCGRNVQLIHRFDGQSSWKFASGEKKVSDVFEFLYHEAAKHKVSDWALGQTTLDDVFAFIVNKHKK